MLEFWQKSREVLERNTTFLGNLKKINRKPKNVRKARKESEFVCRNLNKKYSYEVIICIYKLFLVN